MREQQFRSDLARGILAGRTNRTCARGAAIALRLRYVISQLVLQIPAEQRTSGIVRELARYGCIKQMHVLRLLAPRIENESHTKDIDFSALGISACREAGYAATWNALERAPWRGEFDRIEGVIVHEELAELPSAAEEPQRESSVLVDCRRGSQRMRPLLGRCNKLAAHGSLSPVGPEGKAKYP